MRSIRLLSRPTRTPVLRRRLVGSTLLEAVIALVLFGAGIVGLMGLQAKMVTAQSAGKYRADAAYLVSELVGAMWADVPNVASYATAQCALYARCKDWSDKVAATLPKGTATVIVDNGIVTVTLNWTPPNHGTHAYTSSTAIRI